MSQLCYSKYCWLFFYLCWTSRYILGEDLYNGGTGTQEGSSHFIYSRPEYPRDCKEAKGQCRKSFLRGVHLIKPDGYPEPFEVYCDNTIDSGGWTVIHRLQGGFTLFNRNWTDYKTGFGFLSGEFWIGNDKLSSLTNQKDYELRIYVTSTEGLSHYVTYNHFRISDEFGEYQLSSVGEYSETRGNITMFLCPSNFANEAYTSPDCSKRCSCVNGQFLCDVDYRCSLNAVCEERRNVLQCYCNKGYIGDGVNCNLSLDCQDIYDSVSTESGVYKIKPSIWQGEPFDVYCNMADGAGWTVFQRRVDGSQNFFLYWSDYKNGFGTPDHELWLGHDKLHTLTTPKNYELRVDIVNSFGNPYYAKHSSFRVTDESNEYRLSLGSYLEGDAGDQLSSNNNHAFTTRDRDNDAYSYNNCATHKTRYWCSICNLNAGWWYNVCSYAHLNSPYGTDCFGWHDLPGNRCNLKYVEMKLRPVR